MTSEMGREQILEAATRAVLHERNATYGPPEQDFSRTAKILTALGFRFTATGDDGDADVLLPHHIAMAMIGLKLSRLAHGPEKKDSWVDVAGYAACGADTYERTMTVHREGLVTIGQQVANLARDRMTDAEKYPHRHQMGGIGPTKDKLPPEQRACK